MQEKISQLQQVSNLSGSELLPAVQSGATKSCTPDQIIDTFKASTFMSDRIAYINSSGKLQSTTVSPTDLTDGLQNAADGKDGVNELNAKLNAGLILSISSIKTGSGTLASSRSIPSGDAVSLTSISETFKGAAIVIVKAAFGANANGYRTLTVNDTSVTVGASPSGVTRLEVVELIRSSVNEVEVSVQQNSGSDLNCTASYEFISFDKIV